MDKFDEQARHVLHSLQSKPHPGSQDWNAAVDAIAAALRQAEQAGRAAGLEEYTAVDVVCPREKSFMTPCVARDGKIACADNGVCVGCGEHPADLFRDLVKRYLALHARAQAGAAGERER